MSDLPDCPQCGGAHTYPDGTQLVCPDCAHEWMPGESSATAGAQVRDSNGNPLAQHIEGNLDKIKGLVLKSCFLRKA